MYYPPGFSGNEDRSWGKQYKKIQYDAWTKAYICEADHKLVDGGRFCEFHIPLAPLLSQLPQVGPALCKVNFFSALLKICISLTVLGSEPPPCPLLRWACRCLRIPWSSVFHNRGAVHWPRRKDAQFPLGDELRILRRCSSGISTTLKQMRVVGAQAQASICSRSHMHRT